VPIHDLLYYNDVLSDIIERNICTKDSFGHPINVRFIIQLMLPSVE